MTSVLTAISFVGMGDYQNTMYTWKEKEVNNRFIQLALHKFFNIERHILFLTNEAYDKHAEKLSATGNPAFEFVLVPAGENEQQFWAMFEQIVDHIPLGSKLLVDVTHGYRAQPILMMSVVQYLSAIRRASVEHVVYGSYEKGREKNPVFDLTSFVTMAGWSSALVAAKERMDFQNLSGILGEVQNETYRRNDEVKLKETKSLGNCLHLLGQDIRMNRMRSTLYSAARAVDKLNKVRDELSSHPSLLPLNPVLDELEQEIAVLDNNIVNQVTHPVTSKELAQYVHLIKRLMESGLYLQATEMATELLITLRAFVLDLDTMDEEHRYQAKTFYVTIVQKLQSGENLTTEEKKWSELAQKWKDISEIRNDMSHCGWRKQTMPGSTVKKNLEVKLFELLDRVTQLLCEL